MHEIKNMLRTKDWKLRTLRLPSLALKEPGRRIAVPQVGLPIGREKGAEK